MSCNPFRSEAVQHNINSSGNVYTLIFPSDEFASGETINSVAADTPSPVTDPVLTVASPTYNSATFTHEGTTIAIGQAARVTISGGVSGKTYSVDIEATTTTGKVLAGTLVVQCYNGRAS